MMLCKSRSEIYLLCYLALRAWFSLYPQLYQGIILFRCFDYDFIVEPSTPQSYGQQ